MREKGRKHTGSSEKQAMRRRRDRTRRGAPRGPRRARGRLSQKWRGVPGSHVRSGRGRWGKPGPRRCGACRKAEVGQGGGGTRLRRGPEAGTPDLARRPRGALGPRENRRARPKGAQEAAAQPRLASLIQATFPFPLPQPHAVLAPNRRSSSTRPPPRISARQAYTLGPHCAET